MPPKGKKTKAEEALDFLSNLDNLEDSPNVTRPDATASGSTPRASTDSARPKGKTSTDLSSSTGALEGGRTSTPAQASGGGDGGAEDEEAQKALAFLEAQIKTKRAPLSAPKPSSRPATPQTHAATTSAAPAVGPGSGHHQQAQGGGEAANVSSQPATSGGGGGWGVSSFWSSATSAIQSAQKIADEQYKKVRTEGFGGVAGGLEQLKGRGVDLDALRKGAEERLGGLQGYVKGVDLEKFRQDLLNTTSSTLTNILNTVAPPISAHETLELWLSHPMVGYAGVEGVIYRAWTQILEQTESGELVVVWSPEREGQDDGERGINPVEGWEEGWKRQEEHMSSVKSREEKDPKGRANANPDLPVTTIPIFLHLQPLLAPLPIPEPPVLMKTSESTPSASPSTPAKHLYFLITLHDPTHSLRFSTTTQPSPADWLDVEYDKSDWVEERLVEVLRTGAEVVAQDYVATRMGLKPSAMTRPASPEGKKAEEGEVSQEVKADTKKD